MSVVGSAGTVTFQFGAQGTQIAIQALKSIDAEVKTITGSLQNLKASIGTLSAGTMPQFFQQIGTGAEQASTKTQTFTDRMSGFQGNLLTAATSVGTFTASIFGIDAAMDGLTQSELALEQARVRQDRMQTTLQGQEERLNTLRTSGKASAEDIAIAEDRVNTTRQQVAVQTEKVAFMQQNLSEQYAQFGSQILPQVITASLSGVTAFTSLVELIGKSEKATNLLNKAFNALKAGPSVVEASGAFANLSAELSKSQIVATTFGTAFSAIKPYLGGVAIGIAEILVPLTLYATNFLGARDAMHAAGKSMGDLIPQFQGVLSALESTGRGFTAWVKGLNDTVFSMKEMSDSVATVKGNISGSIEQISGQLNQFVAEVKSSMTTLRDTAEYEFPEESFTRMFGKEEDYVKAAARFDLISKSLLDMQQTFEEGGMKDAVVAEQIAGTIKSMAFDVNTYIQGMGTGTSKGLDLINERLGIFITDIQKKSGADIPATIKDMLNDISGIIEKYGPEISEKLLKAILLDTQPVLYHLTAIQEKLETLHLPPELALQTTRFTEDFAKMAAESAKTIDTLGTTNDSLLKIAYAGLPEMTKALQKNHPEIKTNADTLQYLVDHVDKATAQSDPFLAILLALADAADINKTKTAELTEELTDEQKQLQLLAKQYFDLNLTSAESIEAKKAEIGAVEDAIQEYDDQIDSLKQLQIEYGSNEQATYGVNDATQQLIESKKDQILQLQEETLATIDVTKALDGSKESQILLNQAMIDGKTAAADFVTELAKNEEQTKAYGAALKENVMDVLEKMPQTLSQVAEEMRSVLPETFESLSGFEGAIKPFDKDSLKEYKDMLDDMDISKHTKKLAIKAADIWQDKAEIIKEGEVTFSAISGIISNKFKDIDVEDVTSFLDDIETRVSDWENIAGPSVMTTKMRELITEIKNSKDPVKTFMEKFEEMQNLWDPKGINDTQLAIKLLGENMNTTFAQPVIQNLELTNQLLAKLAGVDLKPTISQIQEFQKSILSKSNITQTDFDLLYESALGNLPKEEKGYTEKTTEADTMAGEWEKAQARIQAATQAIADQVLAMQSAISASLIGISQALLLTATNVDSTQQVFSQFSTSVATYSTSMQTNFNTFATSAVANLDLIDTNVEESNVQWSQLSTSIATYTKSMTTNTDNWSTASVTAFDNVSVALGAFDEAVKILEETVKTSTDNMLTETKEWETEMVKSFKAVQTGADEAATAVGKLYDAVDKLEDKTITVTMKVNETGGSTGNNQSGGVELLTGTKMFTGGEGRKPEIHFFFPLDEMAQSHAKSEFTLPFSIADLGLSKAGPATLMGKPSNQPIIPSNLVSNLRVNANLTIDLGNEIKKRVREEINAIAVTRLDRMAF